MHWKADSLPLHHQADPLPDFLIGMCCEMSLWSLGGGSGIGIAAPPVPVPSGVCARGQCAALGSTPDKGQES